MSDIKSPPHSIEAEQSVIGALLRDNNAVDRLGDLRAEHFYLGDHVTIFTELMAHLAAGRSVDVISMMVALERRINDCGAYLNQLAQNTPSSANIARYAAIVRDKAIKRGLIGFGKDVCELALAGAEDATVMLDRASSRLEKLAEARVGQEPVLASTDLAGHLSELGNRLEIGSKAISTGYPDIDRRLSGGLRPGGLYVLAARPKMGKTAFALNIACNTARDYCSGILSLEMPKSELHDRNLASLGRIPLGHLLEPSQMTDQDWNNLSAAAGKIKALNLYLDDQGGLRLLDVRSKAKAMKRKYGLNVLVIDYLQLMEGDGDNRNAQIEGITRGLKALAKELDIAILLLSQLNRKVEERPNKRPMPSDLRDSGSIEQDADAVILLYRDEVYNPDSQDIGMCEVNVALCRQGAPGVAALSYIGDQTRFESLGRPWVPRPKEEKPRAGRGLAVHL